MNLDQPDYFSLNGSMAVASSQRSKLARVELLHDHTFFMAIILMNFLVSWFKHIVIELIQVTRGIQIVSLLNLASLK